MSLYPKRPKRKEGGNAGFIVNLFSAARETVIPGDRLPIRPRPTMLLGAHQDHQCLLKSEGKDELLESKIFYIYFFTSEINEELRGYVGLLGLP